MKIVYTGHNENTRHLFENSVANFVRFSFQELPRRGDQIHLFGEWFWVNTVLWSDGGSCQFTPTLTVAEFAPS